MVQTLVELNKFNEHLQIIALLKHEAFQGKDWEKLWGEISEKKGKKIPFEANKISLKGLLEEGLLKYTSFIYKISNVKTFLFVFFIIFGIFVINFY